MIVGDVTHGRPAVRELYVRIEARHRATSLNHIGTSKHLAQRLPKCTRLSTRKRAAAAEAAVCFLLHIYIPFRTPPGGEAVWCVGATGLWNGASARPLAGLTAERKRPDVKGRQTASPPGAGTVHYSNRGTTFEAKPGIVVPAQSVAGAPTIA